MLESPPLKYQLLEQVYNLARKLAISSGGVGPSGGLNERTDQLLQEVRVLLLKFEDAGFEKHDALYQVYWPAYEEMAKLVNAAKDAGIELTDE